VTSSSASAGPSAGTSDPRLPEGTYRTPDLTVDQLIAAGVAGGFSPAEVDEFPGWPADAERMVYTLKLEAGRWTLFESVDGGPADVGWAGAFEVIDDDTVVATDTCGAITYRYSMQGNELILDMIEDECQAGDLGELIAQTTIFETAPFTKFA